MGRQWLLTVSVVAALAAGGQDGSAQQEQDHLGLRLGVRALATDQDSYTASESWRPGVEVTLRVPLVGVISGEFLYSTVRTRRWYEMPCPDVGGLSCPPGEYVSGWNGSGAAVLGAYIPVGSSITYSGLGYGRMWESQPAGMFEYGGPLWMWTLGIERRVGSVFSLDLSYKLLRMTWDNDYTSVLQGVHLTHHQLAVGLSLAL